MHQHDTIIVGGGAAGLSAALTLARARRDVVVIDAGEPSNAIAHGIGGLLAHEQQPPADLYAAGRAELARFPTVTIRAGLVVDGSATADGVTMHLADGDALHARTALLAMGMDYGLPPIDGAEAFWGTSVVHCPFCHGYELRDRPLGVLDDGSPHGPMRALMLRAWSDDVTHYRLPAAPELEPGVHAQLTAAGVTVEQDAAVALAGGGSQLERVTLASGAERDCGGLLVTVTLHQRSDLARALGVRLEQRALAADAVAVDGMRRSSIPSVFAAGDVAGEMPSVSGAIAAGNMVGGAIVHALLC